MPPATTTTPTLTITQELKDQIRYLESIKGNLQIENMKLREIVTAAEKVRNRQKNYFASRSKGALRASISAEKELDGLIKEFYRGR